MSTQLDHSGVDIDEMTNYQTCEKKNVLNK